MGLSVAFKRLTCIMARLQAASSQLVWTGVSTAQDTAILSEYKYLKLTSFLKRRRLTLRKKCWNIDDIIYTCNIGPVSASRLCPKEPKYDQICSNLLLSASGSARGGGGALLSPCGWWSDPVRPTTLCLLLLSTKALCLFKDHAQGSSCTAQWFSRLSFKKWKDLMHQTCSLLAVHSFNSIKEASVQVRADYAFARNHPETPLPQTRTRARSTSGLQGICWIMVLY